jgi:hypothetical protein
MLNTGKLLPATDIEATLYVARETFPQMSVFGEQKICTEHKYGLSPGAANTEKLGVMLNPWSEADWQAIMKREQAIFVAVTLTYNDGFDRDSPVSYEWCTQNSYDSVAKELVWFACPDGQIQWLKNVRQLACPAKGNSTSHTHRRFPRCNGRFDEASSFDFTSAGITPKRCKCFRPEWFTIHQE